MAINWDALSSIMNLGGSVASSIIQSRAAANAANTEVEGLERAAELGLQGQMAELGLLRDVYNLDLGIQWPVHRFSRESLGRLAVGMGSKLPPETFATSETPPELPMIGGSVHSDGVGTTDGGSDLSDTLIDADADPSMTGSNTNRMLSMAGAGAAIGSIVPGVGTAIGAGVGAAAGSIGSLFGRGRREANKIVPYQNALTAEIKRIESGLDAKQSAGTLTDEDWTQAINRVSSLKSQYFGLTQDFGRAGPGARTTIGSWVDPLLSKWGNQEVRPMESRAMGGPVGSNEYLVGEQGPEPYIGNSGRTSIVGVNGPQIFSPPEDGMILPNSTLGGFRRMANAIPRAAGGPVYTSAQQAALGNPQPYDVWDDAAMEDFRQRWGGSPADASARWEDMTPATREWVTNRAANNQAEFSNMTNPDGTVRNMTGDEALQYGAWQSGGGANDGGRFQAPANIGQFKNQIQAWRNPATTPAVVPPGAVPPAGSDINIAMPGMGGSGPAIPPGNPYDAGFPGMPRDPNAIGTNPLDPFGTGVQDAESSSSASSAWATPPSTQNNPYVGGFPGMPRDPNAVGVNPNDPLGLIPPATPPVTPGGKDQGAGGVDKNVITQWGWEQNQYGQWVNKNDGDRGYWTNGGQFVNATKNKIFDPRTGQITDYNQNNLPDNQYGDMTSPYDTYPGEFMQPWQERFGFDPNSGGFMPFNEQFKFKPDDLQNNPAYKFLVDENMQAIERSAAAGGFLQSGRTMKELQNRANQLASTEYGAEYGRQLGEYGLRYGTTSEAYQRAVKEYDRMYQEFLANQNRRYSRLSDFAGLEQ